MAVFVGPSTYRFINSTAEAYWNALTVSNGGTEILGNIYDTNPTNYIMRKAFDDFAITGVNNGWLQKAQGHAMYLFFGGGSATHALNFVNSNTFLLTMVGTLTHNKNGVTSPIATAYMKTGYIPNTHGVLNNISLAARVSGAIADSTTQYKIGGSVDASTRTGLATAGTNNTNIFDAYNNTDGGGRIRTLTSINGFSLGSRRASNDIENYNNGVSLESATTSGGSPSTIELYICSLNANGSVSNGCAGTYSFALIGLGLTTAEQLSLYNAVTTLNAVFGR